MFLQRRYAAKFAEDGGERFEEMVTNILNLAGELQRKGVRYVRLAVEKSPVG